MKKYLSKLKKRKELIWNSSFTLSWGQYLLALKMNICLKHSIENNRVVFKLDYVSKVKGPTNP